VPIVASDGSQAPWEVEVPGSRVEDRLPSEQYRLAFERAPQPMLVYDLRTLEFLAVNDAATEHYGYSRSEFMAMTVRDIHPPEDVPNLAAHAPGRVGEFERSGTSRHRKRDGAIVEVEVVSHDLSLNGSRARVVIVSDVTARREVDNAQRAQLLVAQRLAESESVEDAGAQLLDALGTTMSWDAAALWRVETSTRRLRFEAFWCHHLVLDGNAQEELERALRETTFAESKGWAGHAWDCGEPVCVENAADLDPTPCENALARASLHHAVALPVLSGEEVFGVLEFFTRSHRQVDDVALRALTIASAQLGQFIKRERAEQELAYHALHDPLTRLPNRVLFLDRLKLALVRSRRRRSSVAVLLLDIDSFKMINDSLGHKAGDQLLRMIAARIGEILRPGDTVARFGGDEFALILDQMDGAADAVGAAEQITSLFNEPFSLPVGEQFLTASIGISVSRGSVSTADDLVSEADSAQDRAKASGRGHYEVFDKDMHGRTLGRLRTETELREALHQDELRLHYQPVVELASCAIVGFEALLRWNHPERGLLAPAEFIGIAEESGLIIPIGRWVLGEACRQAVEWRTLRPDLPPLTVSVNVSAPQASHGSLDRVVAEVLSDKGSDPGLLRLELTESVLLEETPGLYETLSNLETQGIHLLLDDFGTGYSALGYLDRFPIHGLKVDRSFVAGLGDDAKRSAIVQAVIDMAGALDIEVVGEGVETGTQAGLLLDLGCKYAQGFHFARPLPAKEIEGILTGDRGAPPKLSAPVQATGGRRSPHKDASSCPASA
jgi:diguanylate cyclase (GGDEF)-like protein/PAS domain S-box-containing protein